MNYDVFVLVMVIILLLIASMDVYKRKVKPVAESFETSIKREERLVEMLIKQLNDHKLKLQDMKKKCTHVNSDGSSALYAVAKYTNACSICGHREWTGGVK